MKNLLKRLFFPIYVFFRKRNPVVKNKIDEVLKSYDELIKEYELIKNKQSKLSANQRKEVELRIAFLISKGHIKVN